MKPPRGMPATLRICGTTWTVDYVPDMIAKGDGFGDVRTNVRRIRIALDQEPSVMRCTLLHEAMHAALALNGSCALNGKTVEKTIRALEVPLLSLIRDNRVSW